MSTPGHPPPALLVLSIFSSRWEEFWPPLLQDLEKRFGPAETVSDLIPFEETAYYRREFGAPLLRRMLSFRRLVPQDQLAAIKLATNGIELASSRGSGRIVNIDPGLLTLERLVLATGKNFTHRVYLGKGIYADLTLIFQGGCWKALPWTFPDYAGATLQGLLTEMRRQYRDRLTETDRRRRGEAQKH